ncbi:MAG: uridine kinase [Bacteroides sp. SM23_62_1]|nr:MAG: uridine kinase [Bacteroides sp. SM23_62_1]
MLGDILLIQEAHKLAAAEIKKYALKDLDRKKKHYRYIVAISGESGAGKSELSHSLAKQLKEEHIRVKVLHTDNYYKVPPLLRYEWRRTHGIGSVGINEYDWSLIQRNMTEFKEEREAMMPCIDIIPDQVDKLITDFKKIDLLVIDGLYAIKTKGVDLRVFIDLTYHETKMTQIIRAKEPIDDFRMQVLEREHQNVQSLKPLADLIVNKAYDVEVAKPDDAKWRDMNLSG